MLFKCPKCGKVSDGSDWHLKYIDRSFYEVSLDVWTEPENVKDPDWGKAEAYDGEVEDIWIEHECGFEISVGDTSPEEVLGVLKEHGIIVEEVNHES